MVWISLFLLSLNLWARDLPKFLTKHSIEAMRYISLDGRYAYLQKKAGVLGMVSSFRSVDFISESNQSDFLVKDSRFKRRLAVEIIPNVHHEFNVMKNHKIVTVDWGKSQSREVGMGRNARLHLDDEWITYFDTLEKTLIIHNVVTQKKYMVRYSPKLNPFFIPDAEMISPDTVVYTDVNEKGYIALIQYNLVTNKGNVIYKATQNGTRIELCQEKGYLAAGEFPYDDVARNSKIMHIKLTGTTNLAGYSTIYNSSDSDIGNMVCRPDSIYFIKTMSHNRKINYKHTEAVKLDLATSQVKIMSDLATVSQLINMDGRILIPFRGDFYVVEGQADLTEDKLKAMPGKENSEELPLEI